MDVFSKGYSNYDFLCFGNLVERGASTDKADDREEGLLLGALKDDRGRAGLPNCGES